MSSSNKAADLIKVHKAAETLTNVGKSLNELMREIKSTSKDGIENVTNSKCTDYVMDRITSRMLNIIKELADTDKSLQNVTDLNETKIEADKKDDEHRKSLLFWGVIPTGKEDLLSEIITIVCEYMRVQITREDIRFCYRYGKVVAGKERPLLVRFQSRYIYSVVCKSKHKLLNTNITVEIHLPMAMRSLFGKAQKLFGKHNCFVFEKYIVIITPDRLANYLTSHLQLKGLYKLWLEKKKLSFCVS